ncbi:hypothetical protein AB0953_01740 [Streptomyces sp. NPDC046866]|uniref:hypothetical protein n=1 Tax=Streptomyces sp. NPDC046866 TaxID=3154921 RepID=UPI0034519468
MEERRVVLAAGASYEVRLAGRGALGYVWTWQVTGDTAAVAVAPGPGPGPVPGPSAAGPPGPPQLPGAPLERTYVVTGRRPGGRARIRFAQVRPPYPQEAPYDELVLEVEVTAGPPAPPAPPAP